MLKIGDIAPLNKQRAIEQNEFKTFRIRIFHSGATRK